MQVLNSLICLARNNLAKTSINCLVNCAAFIIAVLNKDHPEKKSIS